MSRRMFDSTFDPLTELREAQFKIQELTDAVILLQQNQNQLILATSDNLTRMVRLEKKLHLYEKAQSQRDQGLS